jgi:hypothetical protein
VICNAWPKDTEGTQSAMALVPLHDTREQVLKQGGTVVIATASPEGLGYHSLMGPGTQLRQRALEAQPGPHGGAHVVYSPNLHREDVRAMWGDTVEHCRTWDALLSLLKAIHGDGVRVCVYPHGAMQYGV